MIKIENPQEKHIQDIYGLAGCEAEEFEGKIVSFPTPESIEEIISVGTTDIQFSKVLTFNDIVVGYFHAVLSTKLPVAMIEQWYVHKNFRMNRKSLQVLKEFELWAKQRDVKTCILSGGYGLDKIKASRLGYTTEITLFAKEI